MGRYLYPYSVLQEEAHLLTKQRLASSISPPRLSPRCSIAAGRAVVLPLQSGLVRVRPGFAGCRVATCQLEESENTERLVHTDQYLLVIAKIVTNDENAVNTVIRRHRDEIYIDLFYYLQLDV